MNEDPEAQRLLGLHRNIGVPPQEKQSAENYSLPESQITTLNRGWKNGRSHDPQKCVENLNHSGRLDKLQGGRNQLPEIVIPRYQCDRERVELVNVIRDLQEPKVRPSHHTVQVVKNEVH